MREKTQTHLTMMSTAAVLMKQDFHTQVHKQERKTEEQERKTEQQERKIEVQEKRFEEQEKKFAEKLKKQGKRFDNQLEEQEKRYPNRHAFMMTEESNFTCSKNSLVTLAVVVLMLSLLNFRQQNGFYTQLQEQERKIEEQERKIEEQEKSFEDQKKIFEEQDKKLEDNLEEQKITTQVALAKLAGTYHTFLIENYAAKIKESRPQEICYSHGFSTVQISPTMHTRMGDYKFYITIDTKNGRDDKLYIGLWSMGEDKDMLLDWPFVANFTIELLNHFPNGKNRIATEKISWEMPSRQAFSCHLISRKEFIKDSELRLNPDEQTVLKA